MVTMHLLLVTAALASGRPRCETTCAEAGCDYYQEGCQCACNRACAPSKQRTDTSEAT